MCPASGRSRSIVSDCAKSSAEGDASHGSAVGSGDKVTLDDSLVAGVFLQIEEEAVDDEDDDGGFIKAKRGAAEAHFVVVPCIGEHGVGTLRGKEEKYS